MCGGLWAGLWCEASSRGAGAWRRGSARVRRGRAQLGSRAGAGDLGASGEGRSPSGTGLVGQSPAFGHWVAGTGQRQGGDTTSTQLQGSPRLTGLRSVVRTSNEYDRFCSTDHPGDGLGRIGGGFGSGCGVRRGAGVADAGRCGRIGVRRGRGQLGSRAGAGDLGASGEGRSLGTRDGATGIRALGCGIVKDSIHYEYDPRKWGRSAVRDRREGCSVLAGAGGELPVACRR